MIKKNYFLFIAMFTLIAINFGIAQVEPIFGQDEKEYWFMNSEGEIQADHYAYIRGYLRVNDFIDAPEFRINGTPVVSSQWNNNGNDIYFNSGNVEIGSKLTLKSPGYNYLTIESDNYIFTGLRFKTSFGTSEFKVYNGSNGWLNYNDFFTIMHSGKVGIGNADPQHTLDVNGTINASQILKNGSPLMSSQWSSSGNNIYYNSGNIGIGTAPSTRLHLENGIFRLTSNGEGIESITNYDLTPGPNFLNLSNSIFIRNNNNVGIGTSSPNHKLDVNGTINATEIYKNGSPLSLGQWSSNSNNIYYNSGSVGIGTTTPKGSLHTVYDIVLGNDINGQKFIIHPTYNANGNFIQITGDDANGQWQWGKGITFVRSTGNVGIGTTSPTQRLSVNGTILSKEVLVSTSSANWPDYVFEKEYDLLSLEELESFVDSKKHLPGIPTSEDVEKSGVQVGEMVSNLLKKVEELTLYVIEQNKHIKKLENEIDQLK